MAIFFSFEGYPGRHEKKPFFQSFGWLSMQNDLEHLGNDLEIDGKSYTSSSLGSNSDFESSSSSSLSDKSEECVILSQVISLGSTCLLQSTSIQNYFMKQPKPSHSSLSHATVVPELWRCGVILSKWRIEAASFEGEKKASAPEIRFRKTRTRFWEYHWSSRWTEWHRFGTSWSKSFFAMTQEVIAQEVIA